MDQGFEMKAFCSIRKNVTIHKWSSLPAAQPPRQWVLNINELSNACVTCHYWSMHSREPVHQALLTFFSANWDQGVDKTFPVFNLTYLIIHLYLSLSVERTGGVLLNLSSLWSAIMVMIRRITWASGSMNWSFRQTKVMLWAWVRGGGFYLGKSPREWNKQHRLISNKESI